MSEKRIVLLATDGESTRAVYHALAARYQVTSVILERPIARRAFLKRRAQRLGLTTVLGQLLFMVLIVPYLRWEGRRRASAIRREYDLCNDPIPKERIVRVPSANGPESLERLRVLAPDYVVVSGTRIISKEVLQTIRVPFLNIHAGMTPMYRGVHGGYWALVSADRENCGVTIHQVDAGIDTGPPLAQVRIEPTPADNFTTYPLLQLGKAIPLLIDALAGSGTSTPSRGHSGRSSRLWSHPTLWEYLRHRLVQNTR